jgi:hypothetical protein
VLAVASIGETRGTTEEGRWRVGTAGARYRDIRKGAMAGTSVGD